MKFVVIPYAPFSLGPNISLCKLFSKKLSLHFPLNMIHKCLHAPKKNTHNIKQKQNMRYEEWSSLFWFSVHKITVYLFLLSALYEIPSLRTCQRCLPNEPLRQRIRFTPWGQLPIQSEQYMFKEKSDKAKLDWTKAKRRRPEKRDKTARDFSDCFCSNAKWKRDLWDV